VSRRLDSIDFLRGLAIAVMALDHARDFFGLVTADPLNPASTWPAFYFSRWITHFCAPVFVFLAGAAAYLQSRRKSPAELARFLFTRGLWLVLLELTFIRCFGWFFNFHYRFSVGQVIWAIGWAMVALATAIRFRLSPRAAGLAGLAVIFLHNLTDPLKAEQFGPLWWLWRILHDRKPMEFYPGHFFFPQYPLLPWIAVLFAGYGFGLFLDMPPERRRFWFLRLGAAATLLFLLLRAINIYGDPRPWTPQPSTVQLLYSFLATSKYPPSFLFLLMTLGPPLLLLAFLKDQMGPWARPLLLFGRVPMFFYLLHLPLLHGAAALYALAVYGSADWLTDAPGWGRVPRPPDFGFHLPGVYAVWLAALALTYPLCRWIDRKKSAARANPTTSNRWLSYI
jgi:uncharacterized membrane protein